MIDDTTLVDIFEAPGALADGDPSGMMRLLPRIMNGDSYDGSPILLSVVANVEVLEFLDSYGVDFSKKFEPNGRDLLHDVASFDDDKIFEWVLSWYKDRNIVDSVNEDGISTLSSLIKSGKIDWARRLIECGADITSVSKNGLTPAWQAVYCLDSEEAGIKCLDLLFSYNLKLSDNELLDMAKSCRRRNHTKMAEWIEKNCPRTSWLHFRPDRK